MIILGLTGSIGMGKSATAEMFAEAGVPVVDADKIVHRLYAGRAAPQIEAAFPGTTENGVVDRQRLSQAVLSNPQGFVRLEAIIHPLVREEEMAELAVYRDAGAPLVLLDIPLLFEVGAENRVDKIAVVSAGPEEQRRRVLARPGMTEEKFEAILKKQVPDEEKRRRADFVIDTGQGFEHTREAVHRLIAELTGATVGSMGKQEAKD